MTDANRATEFMLQLHKKLMDERKLAESSATLYIRSLVILNDKKPFKSLAFLKKTDAVEDIIKTYAFNTQRSFYTAISSILSLFKDTPGYKKTYQYYYDKMMGAGEEAKKSEAEGLKKTKKEEENWISWDEVKKIKDDLESKVDEFAKAKTLDEKQYEILLKLVVLSLYTDIPPRRNKDYLEMVVHKVGKRDKLESLPTDKNYLIVRSKVPTQFIFNVYKTAKKYGQQTTDIPESLSETLSLYLKHHPNAKDTTFHFLTDADGKELDAVNAITRILNRVFGKKVGASMLRHIYLSDKYDGSDMAETAKGMGHSMSQQRQYLRIDIPECDKHST